VRSQVAEHVGDLTSEVLAGVDAIEDVGHLPQLDERVHGGGHRAPTLPR
jgi:hypothetical protein